MATIKGIERRTSLQQAAVVLTLSDEWMCEVDVREQLVLGHYTLSDMRRNFCGTLDLVEVDECDPKTKKPMGRSHAGITHASTLWRLNARGLRWKRTLKEHGWYLADSDA